MKFFQFCESNITFTPCAMNTVERQVVYPKILSPYAKMERSHEEIERLKQGDSNRINLTEFFAQLISEGLSYKKLLRASGKLSYGPASPDADLFAMGELQYEEMRKNVIFDEDFIVEVGKENELTKKELAPYKVLVSRQNTERMLGQLLAYGIQYRTKFRTKSPKEQQHIRNEATKVLELLD